MGEIPLEERASDSKYFLIRESKLIDATSLYVLVQKCDSKLVVVDNKIRMFALSFEDLPHPSSELVKAYNKQKEIRYNVIAAVNFWSKYRFQTTDKPQRVLKVQPFEGPDGKVFDRYIFYLPQGTTLF
jgi:hypothetical protein